ncbi:MAG: DUF4197 domain-containing protein [Pseudomonadota bacterium]|nr:DUF4197 domain-containing protein [Pseudomonadota bacterium]
MKTEIRWLVLCLPAVLGLSVSGPGRAQFDWMEQGKQWIEQSGLGAGDASSLSTAEIGDGLKEALRVGTETVVTNVGRPGGFSADPAIHIPLPGSLGKVRSALGMVGQSAMLDDLELRLNKAAETATPKAKELFWQSISEMTLDDVKGIYNGPDDAATRYFQGKMTPELERQMTPIVQESLAEVGAIQAYDRVMGRYDSIPYVPDVKADLTSYVVEKGGDGIFHYLAIEEAKIREDPASQTTALLKKVFGSN